MKKIISRRVVYVIAGFMLVGLSPSYSFAAGTGNHSHDKGHHAKGSGPHKHDKWETPPANYAKQKISNWSDAVATTRGKVIYDKSCLNCHGADGKGTGPLAKSLAHPPADLTHNFHTSPGVGDGYLFWRVSEGGMVVPFKSMQSSMPPFKSLLNKQQRWDVLIYIHNKFHGGFSAVAKKKDGHSSHGKYGH